MKEDKILEYRIVETDKGFRIEKEYEVNVGFILWPIYEAKWRSLSEGGWRVDWDEDTHYYRTLEEATTKLCQFKNPKYIIHKVEC